MRRSVELLDDVLADESAVPSADVVLARLPDLIARYRRRRRAAWGAAAVLTVVMAASAVAVLVRPAPFTVGWPLGAPMVEEVSEPNVSVAVYQLTPGHVAAYVITPDVVAQLYASAPGATPPDELAAWRARATALTVDGRQGFYVMGWYPYTDHGPLFGEQRRPAPVLAWQYGADMWAFLAGCGTCTDPQAALLNAASVVSFGSSAPITVPVRFGYLPSTWHLRAFLRDVADSNRPSFTRPDRPYGISLDFNDGGAAKFVSIGPADGKNWDDGWDQVFRPNDSIDGRDVFWEGVGPAPRTFAWVDFGTCHVKVAAANHDDVVRIISGLRVANCADRSTWWDARTIGGNGDVPVQPRMPIWLPVE